MDGYILAGCGVFFLGAVWLGCKIMDWAWRDYPDNYRDHRSNWMD